MAVFPCLLFMNTSTYVFGLHKLFCFISWVLPLRMSKRRHLRESMKILTFISMCCKVHMHLSNLSLQLGLPVLSDLIRQGFIFSELIILVISFRIVAITSGSTARCREVICKNSYCFLSSFCSARTYSLPRPFL